MFRKVTISRSIRTLGTMLASGVADARRHHAWPARCAETCYYERLWKTRGRRSDRRQAHLRGAPGQPALSPRAGADDRLRRRNRPSSTVLERVSGYYDQEVETAIKGATSMIEPIMISVMGVVVGTIGMALLLPIFSLSKPA